MLWDNAFFLIMRRMRAPIVILIVVYAISILGLTMIPGEFGAPPLSFFHAFYFISYTATTIGFGEVPHTFSDAQRLWVTICIYLTVISWSYSIVTLIALFNDKAFQLTIVTNRFWRRVKRIKEPFYIICGCGETGSLIAHSFDYMNRVFAVIEKNDQRVQELALESFHSVPAILNADASLPDNLRLAGLENPKCQGVLAVTDDEEANLAIAIAVRLINPKIPVIARARTPTVHDNMASFGTNYIINPFERFADYLVLAIARPERIRLIQILTSLPDEKIPPGHYPPSGYWVLCGYGRFGRAVANRLQKAGIDITIIDPALVDAAQRVVGDGTEESTLKEARIVDAVGIIAGTHSDVNNLSIAVTARALKEDLFVVVRQNHAYNNFLFDSFEADARVIPSRIVAQECMAILTAPLLANFLELLRKEEENWSRALVERLENLCDGLTPVIWEIKLNISETNAAYHALMRGTRFSLADILLDSADRYQTLAIVPLMIVRAQEFILVPNEDFILAAGDKILFASSFIARYKLTLTLQNINEFNYVLTGKEESGWLWKTLSTWWQNNHQKNAESPKIENSKNKIENAKVKADNSKGEKK